MEFFNSAVEVLQTLVVALSGNCSQSDFGLDQIVADSGNHVQSQRPV